ncbi:transmembrane protein [Ceratobasidium sp. AG-Ba]|nr:transmembrane protein [Ceratobasidium sp. AG-Ba]QRW06272.1 transmembrane protein [Ceratobasidium sp. AG-Ba]
MPRQLPPSPRPTPTQPFPRVDEPVVTAPPRLVPLDLAQAELEQPSQQGSSRDHDPVRRTRRRRSQKLEERQAYPSCGDVGNDILSCYPTANTTVVQGGWTRYVWNYRYPEYIGYVNLDIYLFHADSGQAAASWTNVPNAAGWHGVTVGDEFWGTRGVTGWREGQNQTMPFYFLAVSAGATLNGGEPRQSTFTAVQTTLPNFYFQSLASVSSAASAGSLSSLAAQSSQSVESTRSVISLTPSLSSSYATANPTASNGSGSSGNGSLQNGAGDSPFPKWAIALLVILGALALCALLLLAWLASRQLRSRKRSLNRRSTGSSTPIMAPVAAPTTGGGPDSASPIENAGGAPASIIGRPVSLRRGGHGAETGPISGQDAAIMATAFRQMMRKPDFASRPEEEGESPEEKNAREQAELLKEQLAEEGRDIQSVRSERGVRVYTTEDGASLEDGAGWSVGHGSGTPRPGTPRR